MLRDVPRSIVAPATAPSPVIGLFEELAECVEDAPALRPWPPAKAQRSDLEPFSAAVRLFKFRAGDDELPDFPRKRQVLGLTRVGHPNRVEIHQTAVLVFRRIGGHALGARIGRIWV